MSASTHFPSRWLLFRLGFALLLWAGVNGPAAAQQTFLSMKSDFGDYIGAGKNYLYTSQTGTFSVSPSVGNDGKVSSLYIYYTDSANNFWSVNIGTDKIPAPMTAGFYHDAQRAPFAAPGHPGLDVGGNGRGCNTCTGAFQILDAVFDYSTGQPIVKSFAAKFAQHCEGMTPALHGTILYNSTVNPTDTSSPQTTAALSGSVVTLTATDTDGKGDIDATYYQVDHGTKTYYTGPFTLTGAAGQSHTVTCWSFDLAGNQEALHDTTLTLHSNGAINQITLQSESGDYVGGGGSYVLTGATGTMNLQTEALGLGGQANRTTLTFLPTYSTGHNFSVVLATDPIPAPLAPGYYNRAQIVTGYDFGPVPQAGFPGLNAVLDQRGGSTVTGGFQILSLQINQDGPEPQIVSLTGRFVQHDNGIIPSLRGTVQFNSTTPVPPDTTTPVTTATLAADFVTLTAADADAPKDIDRTYYQIDHGPTRVYSGPFPIFGPVGATHVVTVWSQDIAGNSETPKDNYFVVNSLVPASQLALHSQTGDYIGGGQDSYYDSSTGAFTGTFSKSGAQPDAVYIAYQEPNYPFGEYWFLQFDTDPIPAPLVPGYYGMAQRAVSAEPGHPGMDISGDHRGSNTLTGGFQVLEAVYDTTSARSKLISFAARFVQHSEGGSAALYGTILYNSTAFFPPDNTVPVSTVTSSTNVVTLSATDPDSPNDIDRIYYQIDHGTTALYSQPFTIFGPPGTRHTITTWALDIVGNQETPHDTPIVIMPKPIVSRLDMSSEPGDYVGGGQVYHYDSYTGFFGGSASATSGQLDGVSVSYNSPNFSDFWNLNFNTYHLPQPLVPGYYNMAERTPFASAGHPGLEISGNGRGSNTITGSFQVFDATYDASSGQAKLVSFAARFVQHSEGGMPALRGLVQFNSTTPVPDDTSAPTTTAAQSGSQITISVSDPDSSQDIDRTYYQVDHGTLRVYTVPFLVSGPANSTHTVTLWSVDIAGNRETPHDISVFVDGSGPQTYLSMMSQPGDYIGGGQNYFFSPNTGLFYPTLSLAAGSATPYDVSLAYSDYFIAGSSSNWNVTFNTSQTTRLFDTGNFDYAQRASSPGMGHPGLQVSGNGRSSSTLTGRFTVFELVLDNSTTPPTLARFGATFEQHDGGAPAALYGVLRYNSLIAPPLPSPFTTAFLTGTAGLNGWYKSPVQVGISAENPYLPSAIAATQYNLDGTPFRLYTNPFTVTGEGIHTLQFQSVDAMGSQEPLEKQAVKIDSVLPTLTANLTVTGSNSTTTFLTVKGVFADMTSGIIPSSLVGTYLEESRNYQGSAFPSFQSNGAYMMNFYVPAPNKTAKKLKYRLTLTGQDAAGNAVTKTIVVPLTLDTAQAGKP